MWTNLLIWWQTENEAGLKSKQFFYLSSLKQPNAGLYEHASIAKQPISSDHIQIACSVSLHQRFDPMSGNGTYIHQVGFIACASVRQYCKIWSTFRSVRLEDASKA